MAVDAMEVFRRHVAEHDFSEAAMAGVAESLASPFVHMAKTANESKAINARRGPGIVIASSGMMNGGRILHHLAQRLPDPKTTVLVAGFQAAGTRGPSGLTLAEWDARFRERRTRRANPKVPDPDALVVRHTFSGGEDREEIHVANGRCTDGSGRAATIVVTP
jgi:predicted metal-dependent RNase